MFDAMRGLVFALSLSACGRVAFDISLDAGIDSLDDAAIDARLTARACGTSVHFTDELDDTSAMPLFTANTDPGVGVTEELGHLDVNFIAGGAAAMTSAYYTSVAFYPVTDLCVTIDFSVIPTNGGEIFFLLTNTQRQVAFDANPSTLFLVTTIASVRDQTMTLARDPSVHYWRFRNQNGALGWDMSSDGVDFYEHWLVPGFFPGGETVQVLFGAGTGLAPTTAVDIGRFESVRATGP